MIQQPLSLPPLGEMLDSFTDSDTELKAKAREQARLIEVALASFGLAVEVRNVYHGPRLTQFSLKPEADVPLSKIKNLAPDLAVALSGMLAEIEEPTPNYPYLTLLVENSGRPNVKLSQVLGSPAFRRKEGLLKTGLGLDTFGLPVVIDLAALPHLLISGTTGSGKSMAMHAILAGLLCTYSPETLRLLLVDPGKVELKVYAGLPHLVMPVITESTHVLEALQAVVAEIDRRYSQLAQVQVRDIAAYNQQAARLGQPAMPYLVVAIDNLVDLMLAAPKELEQTLTRIAQKARAAGVHLVLATLRTNVATLTGSIKANFPGRLALRVADRAESQLILDGAGAEKLLGQGDMLYKSPETARLRRLQGIYVAEPELKRIVSFWLRRAR